MYFGVALGIGGVRMGIALEHACFFLFWEFNLGKIHCLSLLLQK